jgi:hypothetical protein
MPYSEIYNYVIDPKKATELKKNGINQKLQNPIKLTNDSGVE